MSSQLYGCNMLQLHENARRILTAMSFKQASILTQADRSQRSVFVGNISYEIQEETIRQIFSKVGPVLSIKMVMDRETGKPKGYGFIEFPDVQTAELAIRNLNGYDLHGRTLRVDSAAGGERSADEIAQLQAVLGSQQVEENPYGPEPEEGKAPEAISRVIASLSPEKLFELITQMKTAIRQNPIETKKLLIDHPQLAYALLQAEVVMRVIDPQQAITMLHRENAAPLQPFHTQASTSFGTPMPARPFPPGPHNAPPPTFNRNVPPPMTAEEEQNTKLLMEVMNLSETEIALLPPSDRDKIIELRNQLRNAGSR